MGCHGLSSAGGDHVGLAARLICLQRSGGERGRVGWRQLPGAARADGSTCEHPSAPDGHKRVLIVMRISQADIGCPDSVRDALGGDVLRRTVEQCSEYFDYSARTFVDYCIAKLHQIPISEHH